MTKNEYVLDNLLRQKTILENAEEVDQESIDMVDKQIAECEERIANAGKKPTVKKKR